jgi:sugar lactone lactonase YvrE
VWSKDGRRLYFLDSAQKLVAVDIQAKPDSVSMGEPKTLFQTQVRASIGGGGYDVTRDGKFLLSNSLTESSVPLKLVTDWDKELRKK